MRGATGLLVQQHYTERISIHAPHAGSDDANDFDDNNLDISIHAPHAGSDS